MHIVLISQCEHRSIARTARVLDAYALRQGDRTWMTPITREGLQTLHSILRAGATRQTAVACYVSQGTRQMRLLWIVGAKGRFGPKGEVAVATRRRMARRTEPEPLPAGMRAAALLARLAGYLHDLGKFGKMFQDKLAGEGPMADAVRHEWLSLHIVQELKLASPETPLEQLGPVWAQAWSKAAAAKGLSRMGQLEGRGAPLAGGLRDPWATLLFLVFTHHRLPGDQGGMAGANKLSDGTYVDEERVNQERAKLTHSASPSAQTLDLVRKTAARLSAITAPLGDEPEFWRAVSTVARMGLILADHSVSGVVKAADPGHGSDLQRQCRDTKIPAAFANTVRMPDGERAMNQELNWHLQNVGNEASEFVSHFARFDPAGLSEGVLAGLRATTTGRFAWQGNAAAALRSAQAQERMPTLVFNVAGTGCGKTRMNVVTAAALREGEGSDSKVRIATALNLRTLTLQTRDAYAEQIGMGENELSCVIGCAVAQRLHMARTQEEKQRHIQPAKMEEAWGVDEDGNPAEEEFEASGESDAPPPWLEHFLQRKPKMRSVVMSPVLVCTIDHLIKAGEPTEQGNYALTNLRLMTSDLVLDEIDSYDPKALVAVMRLITSAAFWGRHVIASSATLSSPVARAIWLAYQLGASMRSRLLSDSQGVRFRVAMIDDRCPARTAAPANQQAFDEWFGESLREMLGAYGRASYRPAEIAPVDFAGCADGQMKKQALLISIESACRRMHTRHGWSVTVDGQPHRISLGLVRIANINRAVDVVRHLSESLPQARIACYHSQLPRISRFMLERSLDWLLNRKDPAGGPHCAKEVQDAVRRARQEGHAETMLIVVATPVEEIGRDHDFDWAVIEPSSVQSIVQTVGRVNRHRLQSVGQSNVAVLQYNFRHAVTGGGEPCFTRPGLEPKEQPYPSHDLQQLLDWSELDRCGQIDARARFNKDAHPFAALDDQATQSQVTRHSTRFLRSEKPLWMGRDTYDKVPLREASKKLTISQDAEGQYYQEHRDGPKDTVWLKAQVHKEPRLDNDWLAYSFEEALAEAQRLRLSPLEAFAVEIIDSGDDQPAPTHGDSLGYFKG
jgi:CRISPR-associated endonuclease/helicase Cas3